MSDKNKATNDSKKHQPAQGAREIQGAKPSTTDSGTVPVPAGNVGGTPDAKAHQREAADHPQTQNEDTAVKDHEAKLNKTRQAEEKELKKAEAKAARDKAAQARKDEAAKKKEERAAKQNEPRKKMSPTYRLTEEMKSKSDEEIGKMARGQRLEVLRALRDVQGDVAAEDLVQAGKMSTTVQANQTAVVAYHLKRLLEEKLVQAGEQREIEVPKRTRNVQQAA
jgi:hypothetical protein